MISGSSSSLYILSNERRLANNAEIQIAAIEKSSRTLSLLPIARGKVSKQRVKNDMVNQDLEPSINVSLKSLKKIM